MTHQKLASMIAKLEGKKSQVRVADIREIIKILIKLENEAMENDTELVSSFIALEAAKKAIKPKKH